MLLVLLQLLLLLLSLSLLLPRCSCCCCCCDPLPASQLWRPPCAVVKNYKQFMRLGCLLYLLQFTPSTTHLCPPLVCSFLLHQAGNMQRMPSAFAFAVNCVRERVRKREGMGARREKTTCSRIALQLLEHLRGMGRRGDGGLLAGATL